MSGIEEKQELRNEPLASWISTVREIDPEIDHYESVDPVIRIATKLFQQFFEPINSLLFQLNYR